MCVWLLMKLNGTSTRIDAIIPNGIITRPGSIRMVILSSPTGHLHLNVRATTAITTFIGIYSGLV